MPAKTELIARLALTGLETAPSQVCGAVRLVPLRRREVRGDLRLAVRPYGEDLTLARVPNGWFGGYVPHGLVVSWTDNGEPVAAFGGQLKAADDKKLHGRGVDWGFAKVRLTQRIAKREYGANRLRLLPMDVAMEGFLSLCFGGPEIAWAEYSRRLVRHGLTPRIEYVVPGRYLAGFERALRVFEIVEGQVGMLVFIAEALAAAFVTPHPDDYRLLHPTLLEDYYGELLWHYAVFNSEVPTTKAAIDGAAVRGFGDLRAALVRMREDWAGHHGALAGALIDRPVEAARVYDAGPFTLQRFMTDLDPSGENHIGEAIVRQATGEVEYLKTYRLSGAQTRRAYLLKQLAAHEWDLDATASALQTDRTGLVRRLENADFGYLLDHNVLVAARREARELRRK